MQEKIISTIKEKYNRNLRKQIVKSIQISEKNNDQENLESSYKTINLILSYIISELKWRIANSSGSWDDTPLKIMREAFPKIETTKWFKDQQLCVKGAKNPQRSCETPLH
ncbi:MAG: hypothetical protein U9P72_07585 [Campylobacterota bacterium]|nr:hypothetical protein [Campylobacterota bacterium]